MIGRASLSDRVYVRRAFDMRQDVRAFIDLGIENDASLTESHTYCKWFVLRKVDRVKSPFMIAPIWQA
jgi:hypothetical protein